jgi:hypothetical protein
MDRHFYCRMCLSGAIPDIYYKYLYRRSTFDLKCFGEWELKTIVSESGRQPLEAESHRLHRPKRGMQILLKGEEEDNAESQGKGQSRASTLTRNGTTSRLRLPKSLLSCASQTFTPSPQLRQFSECPLKKSRPQPHGK